jgi:hypothetical protein
MSRSPPYKPPPPGRVALAKREGERLRFRATVGRFGSKTGFEGKTIKTVMVTQVYEAGMDALLTDHLWFDRGKWSVDLHIGDVFEFDARVANYIKGTTRNKELYELGRDWNLQRPTRVAVVTPAPIMQRRGRR